MRNKLFQLAAGSAEHDLTELGVDFFCEVVKVLIELLLGLCRDLEFHLTELQELLLKGVLDDGPRDLALALNTLSDDTLGVVVEAHNALHHADGLVQRAVVIVF